MLAGNVKVDVKFKKEKLLAFYANFITKCAFSMKTRNQGKEERLARVSRWTALDLQMDLATSLHLWILVPMLRA
jgi:hypothetical protein